MGGLYQRPSGLALPAVSLVIFTAILPVFLPEKAAGQELPRFRLKEEAAREHFKKGLAFYHAQNYVAAREFFYKSLNVQPYFHLARRFLGDAYYYSGDWNGALEQWENLDEASDGAYPLVRQRREILRFYLNARKDPGDYSYYTSYEAGKWRAYDNERPVDAVLDDKGSVYVCYFKSANVLRITPGGEVSEAIRGPFYDRLRGPMAAALHGDRLYVADYSADRVRVFDRTGAAVASFGGTGALDGQFHGPSGIAVSSEAVYVSDSGNRRIQRFDLDGKLLSVYGVREDGELPNAPSGLALDAEENLYVADTDAGTILVYDRDGNHIEDLRSAIMTKPRSVEVTHDGLVVADEESGVLFYQRDERRWLRMGELRSEDDKPVLLNRPFAVRADPSGILYIPEFAGQRLTIAMPRGLRISNLDMRIQRMDLAAYPDVAVFLTAKNRLGNHLPGISRADMFVFENDSRVGRIRADNVEPFNRRLNLVIVKENSKVFQDVVLPQMPAALEGLLGPIRIADRIRVVRVGDQVRPVYEGLERRAIVRAMSEGESIERPNIGKGLFEGTTILLPDLGPRSVLLVASGRWISGAYDQYSLERILSYARANEIRIHVLSWENDPDPAQKSRMEAAYRELASLSGGKYYQAYRETELRRLYADMAEAVDQRYVLTYKSALGRLPGRYVDVRVEIRHMGTQGIADGGYFVP